MRSERCKYSVLTYEFRHGAVHSRAVIGALENTNTTLPVGVDRQPPRGKMLRQWGERNRCRLPGVPGVVSAGQEARTESPH